MSSSLSYNACAYKKDKVAVLRKCQLAAPIDALGQLQVCFALQIRRQWTTSDLLSQCTDVKHVFECASELCVGKNIRNVKRNREFVCVIVDPLRLTVHQPPRSHKSVSLQTTEAFKRKGLSYLLQICRARTASNIARSELSW